jgi:hypothetical protein
LTKTRAPLIELTFAVEPNFPLPPQYHRHSLAHVVKVEDAQQLVGLLLEKKERKKTSREVKK